MSKRGFAGIHVGHAGGMHHGTRHILPKRSDCSSGSFYQSPSSGDSVSTDNKLNITWDTSCLSSTTAIDIFLYAPHINQTEIHVWSDVNYANGNYEPELKPEWWNSTSSIDLQLAIVKAGNPIWMTELPAGPIFTATYSGTEQKTTSSSESIIERVSNFAKGISKGGIAAAVIVPLLVVGLCAFAFVHWKRKKGLVKRKRWSEAVDKRMSTISQDWKSISAAGAQHAIRNSVAINNRASSYSFGNVASTNSRASSAFATEGSHAGIGAGAGRGMYSQDNVIFDESEPQMAQARPNLRGSIFTTGERISRVSFAEAVPPSRKSMASTDAPRRSIASDSLARRSMLARSRAYHDGQLPPMPMPQRHDSDILGSPTLMSPNQKEGPFDLSSEDIQARISGAESGGRPSIDHVLPPLEVNYSSTSLHDEVPYFSPIATNSPMTFPTPPAPAATTQSTPQSPIIGAMPMPAMPASVMSPDEMLRAYAASRAGTNSAPGTPAPAPPQPSYNGNGMRALYNPPTQGTFGSTTENSFRTSLDEGSSGDVHHGAAH